MKSWRPDAGTTADSSLAELPSEDCVPRRGDESEGVFGRGDVTKPPFSTAAIAPAYSGGFDILRCASEPLPVSPVRSPVVSLRGDASTGELALLVRPTESRELVFGRDPVLGGERGTIGVDCECERRYGEEGGKGPGW